MSHPRRRGASWSGRATWFVLGAAVALIVAWKLTPGWSHLVLGSRVVEIAMVISLFVYLALLALATVGLFVLAGILFRRRRSGRRSPLTGKLLAACVAFLVAALFAEGVATFLESRSRRPPTFPITLPEAPPHERDLIVIGGSSAYGEPFVPHLSIGQIVAWKLEEGLGDRERVRLVMLAEDGLTLQQSSERLHRLVRRPSAVLILSGHNEFQARIPWSREVLNDGGSTARLALGYNPWRSGLRPDSPLPVLRLPRGFTPLMRLINKIIDQNFVYSPPPLYVTRPLVDRPSFTQAEHDVILANFERRLEAIVAFCVRMQAVPILVIPPANESRFDPNRSSLPSYLTQAERENFARDFLHARASEHDPESAIRLYQILVRRQPGFAESHYRLARLLEARGQNEEAHAHAQKAIDLDGWPIRCTTPFREVYRAVATRHPSVLLIDGPAVLRARSANGLLGEKLFVDPHHPSLVGHVALAEAILNGLHGRKLWGWSDAAKPRVNAAECAEHFGIGRDQWAAIAQRPADFLRGLAYVRHDPSERLALALRYWLAVERIKQGCPIEEVGVSSLGTQTPPEPADSQSSDPLSSDPE